MLWKELALVEEGISKLVSYIIFILVVTLIIAFLMVGIILLIFWWKLRSIKKRIPSDDELEKVILKQGYIKDNDEIFVRRRNGNGREENRRTESEISNAGIQVDDTRCDNTQVVDGKQDIGYRGTTKKYKLKIRKG